MDRKRALKLLALPALAGGAMAFALTGGATASQPSGDGQHLSSKEGVIVAKGGGHHLRYSSTTVDSGNKLEILNHTKQPHTLSLVVAGQVPHTASQVKLCNSRGHICAKIAKWHKFNPQTQQLGANPTHAGRKGWDTQGSLHRTGDSVFFGPGQSPKARTVVAPAGTVLHFVCAIHPFMHGRIVVQ